MKPRQKCNVFREPTGDLEVVGLCSDLVDIAVVPALGSKIVRLHDRHADREWTWSARTERTLHRNKIGDDFERSPLIGIDECIPTIAPCRSGEVEFPDHGEAWMRTWELDDQALDDCAIVTSLMLSTCPLRLVRRITVEDARVRIDYTLQHLGFAPIPYAWALHPLFAMRQGDHLEIADAPAEGRVDSAMGLGGLEADGTCAWPSPLPNVELDTFALGREPACVKLYLRTAPAGSFAIVNDRDGTTLRCRYGPPEVLPYLGVWITRGGWNGFHHFAIEPCNVDNDDATAIDPERSPAAVISPRETRQWFVHYALGR